jgi:tetratricopeptide (TPR) repeat protein
MSMWTRIVTEVHRRSLWQVLGIYLVSAWIGYQVILGVYDGFGLPDWVPPFALVLFIIGLPVVLATAFVQEGGPTLDAFRPGTAPPQPDRHPTPLADVRSGGEAVAVVGRTPGAADVHGVRRVLTWRRSLVAGGVAFTLLAVVTAGFMTVRSRSRLIAQGVFDTDDLVVLADFTSTGADVTLGEVVTEALRIDLLSSDVFRLADAARVNASLRRMQRDDAASFTADVAREVAERDGFSAVLAGEIGSLGSGYVLSAQLLTPAEGTVLAGFRTSARDSTELIDAVDDLSRQIRDRIGESLKSIRATPALADVSTRSLPALRKYVEADRVIRERGDLVMGVELFEEAVALDSAFAMAWRKIGVNLNNIGISEADRNRAITRAYDLRERLSEKERFHAVATHARYIRGDLQASVEAYQRALQLDPEDAIALTNLPLALTQVRRTEEAESYYQRGTELHDANSFHFGNLIAVQYRLGKIDSAKATFERGRRVLPDNFRIERLEMEFAATEGRWSAVDSLAETIGARHRDNATARVIALRDRERAALIHGRLADHEGFVRDIDAVWARHNLQSEQLQVALIIAEATMRVRADPERGLREIEDALSRFPLDSIAEIERPYALLAELYADAGRFDLADATIALATAGQPPPANPTSGPFSFQRAYIAMRRGDPAPGIARFRVASSFPEKGSCRICDLQFLGQAYEIAHQPDSARAVYERFLSEPHYGRLVLEPLWRPFVLERVAALHEAAGDTVKAVQRYSEFIRLWENADPELQPRVNAARRHLIALRGPT